MSVRLCGFVCQLCKSLQSVSQDLCCVLVWLRGEEEENSGELIREEWIEKGEGVGVARGGFVVY